MKGSIMRLSRIVKATAVLVGMATGLAPATGWSQEAYPLGQKKIIYTYGPWGAGLALTTIGASMLKRLGYEAELKLVDVGLGHKLIKGIPSAGEM